jgi:serine/threonine protein kinase
MDLRTTLGRHVLLSVLGSGRMGTVWRARHLMMGRLVAIKVLLEERFADPEALARFELEARAAAHLDHPNIVRVFDSGRDGGCVWYSMELIEGESLRAVIERRGRLAPDLALDVAIGVARALEAAFEARIVHRDVKPENVLLPASGGAKLADLGLARWPKQGRPDITQEGDFFGTPAYMSPEQACDPRNADHRSDLWSLGATLFHALFGRAPFEGVSAVEVVTKAMSEDVVLPRESGSLPSSVREALLTLLRRSPAERYPTPGAARRALEEARLDLEPDGARRSRRLGRRRTRRLGRVA